MPITETDIQDVIGQIRAALAADHRDEAARLLLELHVADQADLFDLLNPEERRRLLPGPKNVNSIGVSTPMSSHLTVYSELPVRHTIVPSVG